MKAPVLLALGAALVFGACDTNAVPAHAVLYGTWFGDGETYYRTAVISANSYRMDATGGNYVEIAIESWEEAVNDGDGKETYPAGYTMTGTVTEVNGWTGYGNPRDTCTITFYLSNDRKAYLYEGNGAITSMVFIRCPWPLPKGGN